MMCIATAVNDDVNDSIGFIMVAPSFGLKLNLTSFNQNLEFRIKRELNEN